MAALATAPAISAGGGVNPLYTRIAGMIAGWEVPVFCYASNDVWGLGHGVEGVYLIRAREIHLSPDVCAALAAARISGLKPLGVPGRLRLANAVATLAHEANHAGGIRAEKRAECYSIQQVAFVGQELGLGRKYSRGLANLYWKVYDDPDNPYWSPKCRDGGAWDLYAGSVWP